VGLVAEAGTRPHDDRVLAYTRGLSLFILPFLLVAFVILYLFPGDTARLWSWPIKPTMTPMVLASAYLGGAWFFLRVQWERRWHAVRSGFPAVALFATLLGIATLVHWDRFSHHKVAFWIWAALYFVAPFLVVAAWVVNQRYAAPARPGEPRLGPVSRTVTGLAAAAALLTGASMFAFPDAWIPHWPWLLTPLTCRVVAAVFCLGSAGIGGWRDPRWSTLGLMLEVAIIMLGLMLLAVVRAQGEFDTGRSLTWPLLVGTTCLWAGSVYLRVSHRRDFGPAPLVDRSPDSSRGR
jgi:hypothetical protein